MGARSVSRQRLGRLSLWRSELSHHFVALGLLLVADFAVRRRVYPGLRGSFWLASSARQIRGARRAKGNRKAEALRRPAKSRLVKPSRACEFPQLFSPWLTQLSKRAGDNIASQKATRSMSICSRARRARRRLLARCFCTLMAKTSRTAIRSSPARAWLA